MRNSTAARQAAPDDRWLVPREAHLEACPQAHVVTIPRGAFLPNRSVPVPY